MRPASEEGGEVVPVPEEHRPTQPVEEVLWGLVSGSTSHQQQGPFTGAELHRQLAASQPALHPYTEHHGASLPHLVLLQLCCFSVTETFLAFHSQVSFYFCLTFIPYGASVSDFVRLAFCFKTQLYLKNSLLFCILLLLAALLLFRCLQHSQPFCCLSHGFPLPHCRLIPSTASFLQLFYALLLSKVTGSGLDCILLSVDLSILKVKNQHPFIVT